LFSSAQLAQTQDQELSQSIQLASTYAERFAANPESMLDQTESTYDNIQISMTIEQETAAEGILYTAHIEASCVNENCPVHYGANAQNPQLYALDTASYVSQVISHG
jgi:hypothetical protein